VKEIGAIVNPRTGQLMITRQVPRNTAILRILACPKNQQSKSIPMDKSSVEPQSTSYQQKTVLNFE
jgi:hypothetical protein